jgi:hypothetical protein
LCGEAPNEPNAVLIADGVACFQHKWEADLRAETPDVDALTAAAGKDLGGDVGKPLVARYIARKLTTQTPPVVPPTLKKIIQKAVAVAWKKSCILPATAQPAPAPVAAVKNG